MRVHHILMLLGAFGSKYIKTVYSFENAVNPGTHFHHTGEEIHEALGPVDLAVMGAGTGGTMTGVGYKLKEYNPKCMVVAADPDGSVLFNTHGDRHPYLVEGVTGGYVPIVLDKSVVDSYEVVTDEESFLMARELCRKEGLLCGSSGGLITAAAVNAAKRLKLKAGQRVVVILPDGIRNYMTKFVSDQWMEAHRFIQPPKHDMKWWDRPVTDMPKNNFLKMSLLTTCAEAFLRMKTDNSAGVVIDTQGSLQTNCVILGDGFAGLYNTKTKQIYALNACIYLLPTCFDVISNIINDNDETTRYLITTYDILINIFK